MNTPNPPNPYFTAPVSDWPALPGGLPLEEVERRLRTRDLLRLAAERAAWAAGLRTVRLVDVWGKTLDTWTLDPAKFTPHPGERVLFPSRSAACGERTGRVLRVTPTRARVAFTFGNGRATETWVPLAAVRRPDVRPRLGV